jgi:hypothetical protein
MIKEQSGSNSWGAPPDCKTTDPRRKSGNSLIEEELTPLQEHQHRKLGNPTNNGAREGNQKCIKVGAVDC